MNHAMLDVRHFGFDKVVDAVSDDVSLRKRQIVIHRNLDIDKNFHAELAGLEVIDPDDAGIGVDGLLISSPLPYRRPHRQLG